MNRALPLLASRDLHATEAFYDVWRTNADDSARFTPLTFTNYGMRAFTLFDADGNEIRVGWPPR